MQDKGKLLAFIPASLAQNTELRSCSSGVFGIHLISKENSSPRAIAEAYRHHARETAQISTEIKGIDDAIAALKAQLENKQAQLEPFSRVQQQLSKQEELDPLRF